MPCRKVLYIGAHSSCDTTDQRNLRCIRQYSCRCCRKHHPCTGAGSLCKCNCTLCHPSTDRSGPRSEWVCHLPAHNLPTRSAPFSLGTVCHTKHPRSQVGNPWCTCHLSAHIRCQSNAPEHLGCTNRLGLHCTHFHTSHPTSHLHKRCIHHCGGSTLAFRHGRRNSQDKRGHNPFPTCRHSHTPRCMLRPASMCRLCLEVEPCCLS
mmetsp:Transcript_44437/g.105280  ORF Transcript_44437/g.105280 Transcript_44437/m.105280 type:complete len:206 (+) Transcript_44437:469-1086(+)